MNKDWNAVNDLTKSLGWHSVRNSVSKPVNDLVWKSLWLIIGDSVRELIYE